MQKNGYVRIRQNGTVRSRPFLDIHRLVSTGSEQGLLSMAFDPDYATNGRFYVDYTNTGGDTRVVRYRVKAGSPNVADPASRKVLLKVHQPFANHNGGQLQFGPDGKLYVGLGDGGSEGDPNLVGQSLKTRLAKILRLNLAVSPIKVRTYAYGLRNPWRFSFDSKTGNLWIGDVGQNNWEEIDFLKAGTTAGTNFGWSYYEGDHVYKTQPIDRSRLKFPATEYSHSLGSAVIGGYVYRGSADPGAAGRLPVRRPEQRPGLVHDRPVGRQDDPQRHLPEADEHHLVRAGRERRAVPDDARRRRLQDRQGLTEGRRAGAAGTARLPRPAHSSGAEATRIQQTWWCECSAAQPSS